METYDVVVLGAGPAGLAAGLEAAKRGGKTLIIERESRPGGILKQCIHDGFGLIEFKEKLSGPEYAERYIRMVRDKNIPIMTSTFATKVLKDKDKFIITLVNSNKGVFEIESKTMILANGCRERTSKQIFIHGSRPSGVYTAGTAQYFINILGYLPCKKCVILGSGDIGLIMARRLTLEGAKVIGVYEAKTTPSGLTRNIVQCLYDYDIPLYLSRTITRIIGDDRVEGVIINEVDENMKPIKGTEKLVECDGVILSVGLIPENEIAESLGIEIDKFTKGPCVDHNFMTLEDGVFSCGNALHVNDLVDYVTESGRYAGERAVVYAKNNIEKNLVKVNMSVNDFLYVVPQYIDITSNNKKVVLYFRSREIRKNVVVQIKYDNKIVFTRKYRVLRPPEMQRIELDLTELKMSKDKDFCIVMKEGQY
ncbi:NAD(P)/FAD-dependent oxidoreductase [Caloranaerobacter ferrireducens]|uniref:NAD(P)/FAD-dependent oxidoreductase n=1 Tax=Caloranaerobacter ferrireducens TaxID=1323370 RepID=UPI00084D2AE7|nr:FAD-dependent oxidoreductase [Caloranaerobacter ferrireducens]